MKTIGDTNSDTNIWGPIFWQYIDMMVLYYDEMFDDVYNMYFSYVLPNTIPCGECQDHYVSFISKKPFNAKNIRRWVLDLHNYVNKRNNKDQWNMKQYNNKLNNYIK